MIKQSQAWAWIKLQAPMGRRMQKQRLTSLAASLATAAALTFGASTASAVDLEEIFAVSAEGNRVAQASQVRIDTLSEETGRLLQQYKTVLKEIEGLRVYNAQLERQIRNQETEMANLNTSIEEVTLIERQISPMMEAMLASLDDFIRQDVPFLHNERQDRIARLQEMMGRADVSPSEKFRRVFEAYQIENDFGRTIEAYEDTLPVNGSERDMFILRIGRVGLYYQTKDGSLSGMWNQSTSSWEELDDDFADAISEGIRIANAQTSPNLIRLPIVAPE
jgi:DNA repair exonuclease SbcCD ATPase subunit